MSSSATKNINCDEEKAGHYWRFISIFTEWESGSDSCLLNWQWASWALSYSSLFTVNCHSFICLSIASSVESVETTFKCSFACSASFADWKVLELTDASGLQLQFSWGFEKHYWRLLGGIYCLALSWGGELVGESWSAKGGSLEGWVVAGGGEVEGCLCSASLISTGRRLVAGIGRDYCC